jgi:hypothetical protein
VGGWEDCTGTMYCTPSTSVIAHPGIFDLGWRRATHGPRLAVTMNVSPTVSMAAVGASNAGKVRIRHPSISDEGDVKLNSCGSCTARSEANEVRAVLSHRMGFADIAAVDGAPWKVDGCFVGLYLQ